MSFIWPVMLMLLGLVPLLVGLYLWLQGRRRRFAANFDRLGLKPPGGKSSANRRRHVPPMLFLAGLIMLFVAMARPQTTLSLPRVEGTIILAFDESGSMAADDLTPTRMEAAKAAARSFVAQQPRTVQIGVVGFSESGFAVQVPTNEPEAILAAIDRLAPQRGTSLGSGILTALNTIEVSLKQRSVEEVSGFYTNLQPTPAAPPTPVPDGMYLPALIVLLTDGENNASPDPLEAAQTAANRGVRIFPIGIGSPAGATLKIDGFNIHTQLDEELLKAIAQLTDGAYYTAADEAALHEVYDIVGSQLIVRPEKTEVTSLLAGAGLLMLLIGSAASLRWLGRLI